MRLMHFFILALATLTFAPAPVAAQDYGAWDRNGDGVITRSEWRGTLQDFRDRDWNRDGVISGKELWTEEWESSEQWDMQTFARLDRNRDGRLSRAEWNVDTGTFRRLDRNRDNQITRGEFMNANAGVVDEDTLDFDTLDDDFSGRIERAEWIGTRAEFNRLDRNRDGVISRREFAASDVVVASVDEFDQLDVNRNGVLSRSEWQASYGSFAQYDRNRDGLVTRREYDAAGTGSTALEQTLLVDARMPWTDTGVYVNAGDVVSYTAAGTIQMSDDVNDRATAAGSLRGRTAKNAPRPDQSAGGLLLRIGGSPVTFLGDSGSFTAQNSGRLYLGVNDDHFGDNAGQYSVRVVIKQQ